MPMPRHARRSPMPGASRPGRRSSRPSADTGRHPFAEPLVVAVGRLVPVKRFDRLIDALATVRATPPRVAGGDRGRGLRARGARGAGARARRRGLDLDARAASTPRALVDLYRRAWVLASASAHEGWGMTITEAAACGTPAVATRIAGHADAVVHEPHRPPRRRSGRSSGAAIERLIADDALRASMSADALAHAARSRGAPPRAARSRCSPNEALRRRRS